VERNDSGTFGSQDQDGRNDMDAERFTFEEFDRCLQRISATQEERRNGPQWELWGVGLILIGALIGFGAVAFLHAMTALITAVIGFGIEIAGMIVLVVGFLRNEWHQLRHPLRDDARLLDTMFEQGAPVFDWLSRFSQQELERCTRFVRDRRLAMTQGMNWMFGPIERLGPLPVLVALYLQFKDVHAWWPIKIDPIHGALAFLLLLFYALGTLSVLQSQRRRSYENWLIEALARKREGEHDSAHLPVHS
jgi:hypothetical protein